LAYAVSEMSSAIIVNFTIDAGKARAVRRTMFNVRSTRRGSGMRAWVLEFTITIGIVLAVTLSLGALRPFPLALEIIGAIGYGFIACVIIRKFIGGNANDAIGRGRFSSGSILRRSR
jgi:hypothetical protein